MCHENVILESDVEVFTENRKKIGWQKTVAKLLGLSSQQQVSFLELNGGIDNRTYSLLLLLANKHPNYTLEKRRKTVSAEDLIQETATGAEIKALRKSIITNPKTGKCMTQGRMASLLGLTGKSLIYNYEKGKQSPSKQCWTLFLLIVDKHPKFKLKPLD